MWFDAYYCKCVLILVWVFRFLVQGDDLVEFDGASKTFK